MKIARMVTASLTATLVFALAAAVADAQPSSLSGAVDGRYEGSWVTTKNKKLNGTASCQVRQLGRDRWEGRFWGIWQQVPFDYKVEFAAAKAEQNSAAVENAVRGTATIDGAYYDWTGTLTPTEFNIQFTGTRYEGQMELKRVADK